MYITCNFGRYVSQTKYQNISITSRGIETHNHAKTYSKKIRNKYESLLQHEWSLFRSFSALLWFLVPLARTYTRRCCFANAQWETERVPRCDVTAWLGSLQSSARVHRPVPTINKPCYAPRLLLCICERRGWKKNDHNINIVTNSANSGYTLPYTSAHGDRRNARLPLDLLMMKHVWCVWTIYEYVVCVFLCEIFWMKMIFHENMRFLVFL